MYASYWSNYLNQLQPLNRISTYGRGRNVGLEYAIAEFQQVFGIGRLFETIDGQCEKLKIIFTQI